MNDEEQTTGTTAVLDKPTPTPQPASSGNQPPPTIPTAVGNMESHDHPKEGPVSPDDIANLDPNATYNPSEDISNQ